MFDVTVPMRAATSLTTLLLVVAGLTAPACRRATSPVPDAGAAALPTAEPGPCTSWASCGRECNAGQGAACARAAAFAFSGQGTARDFSAGWALEWRACQTGHGPSCARVALSAQQGVPALDAGLFSPALERARSLLQPGCAAGDAEACQLAAALARAGHLAADAGTFAQQARAALGRGCDAGVAEACNRLGLALFEGDEDVAGAVAALDRGCTLGLAGACAALGLRLLGGQGVQADVPRARGYLARARVLSQDAGLPGGVAPTPR